LAGVILVILGLTAATLAVAFSLIREHYIDTLATDLEHTAGLLRTEIQPLLDGNPGTLQERVRAWGGQLRARVTVVDAEGRVLADSQADPAAMDNHRNRPEFHRAFAGEPGRDVRFSSTIGREMLYVSVPVLRDGRVVAAVRMSLFLSDIERLLGRLRLHLLAGALAAAALASLVAYLLARHLAGPIGALAAAAQELAAGRLDARVFLHRRDELQGLADRFNAMAGRLEGLFAESERNTEELNHILDSLQDGLLVLDRDGRVVVDNPKIRELAGGRALAGRMFWEAFREPAFTELVKATLGDGRPRQGAVELPGGTYLCGTTPLEAGGGCIALLRDITEWKRLERIKRDFVVNASHELRTPLTAIRGYAETLEEETAPPQREHAAVIRRHADRLARLVEDLLALAELEERGPRLETAPLDLGELARSSAALFGQAARDKGLALRVEGPDFPVRVQADRFRMEQVVINLLDNAIKYTERGEVVLSIVRDGEGVRLAVRDTGPGIPPEHLPRLFERFYVVDKSRSRTMGGTGLGLAIVKHIVQLHGGTVTVESVPGQGSTFQVTLPA
jgi:two-component system phosphate regulon sensor histidine kinase PhoR